MFILYKWTFVCYIAVSTLFEYTSSFRMRGEPYVSLANVDKKPLQRLRDNYDTQSRIIGGEPVEISNVPWQVSIENHYYYHICGGAIINENYILTAASCVVGLQKSTLRVLTGTTDWWNLTNPEYFVDDIIIHCNFDKPLYHNDIALLKLSKKLILNDVTQIVPIAQLDELQENEELSFTGWGSEILGEPYPTLLSQLSGNYLPNKECKAIYGGTSDVDLGHLCVKQVNGQGVCHGDTGGPLVNKNGELVGISNWGVPCGYGFPDVYARVSYYTDWIRTTIAGCHN